MDKTVEVGRVVTVDKRHHARDRESGRVVAVDPQPGYYARVTVRFAGGGEATLYAPELMAFGTQADDRKAWAPGQAIILLDSYPDRGVDAHQLARVVTVSPTGKHLEARARGTIPDNAAWRERVAGLSELLRRDRVPLPTYHEIIEDMRRGWHRGWIAADRCYRIPS